MQNDVFHIEKNAKPNDILVTLEKASEEAKGKHRGDWAENLQQIAGHLRDQVTAFVEEFAKGLYSQTPNTEYAGTPFNVVMPFVNRYVSRVTHLPKEYQVLPADDDEDEDQALADEKLLNARWQTSGMRVAAESAIVFACATSHGFVFTDADDTLDPQLVEVPLTHLTGEPILDLRGEPVVERRKIPQGDTVHWALSSFSVDLYPNQHGLDGSPVLAVHVFMSEEDIKRRWGWTIPNTAKAATTGHNIVDKLYANSRFLWKVSHLFFAKTSDRPRGEHYVILGGEVIHKTRKDGKPWIGTWNNKYLWSILPTGFRRAIGVGAGTPRQSRSSRRFALLGLRWRS